MQSLETKISRPRPKSFETETRPETFENETPRNGFRDRDQVSRLRHGPKIGHTVLRLNYGNCFKLYPLNIESFETETCSLWDRESQKQILKGCMAEHMPCSGVTSPKSLGVKSIEFERAIVFYLWHRLLKHKMTRYARPFRCLDPLRPLVTPILLIKP